jgi:hypothetical protein
MIDSTASEVANASPLVFTFSAIGWANNWRSLWFSCLRAAFSVCNFAISSATVIVGLCAIEVFGHQKPSETVNKTARVARLLDSKLILNLPSTPEVTGGLVQVNDEAIEAKGTLLRRIGVEVSGGAPSVRASETEFRPAIASPKGHWQRGEEGKPDRELRSGHLVTSIPLASDAELGWLFGALSHEAPPLDQRDQPEEVQPTHVVGEGFHSREERTGFHEL